MPIDLPQSSENQRIDSWKEIAAFFGRDERTVKRWEGQRGLPVHRVPGGRGTVYAFTRELTAWLRSSQQNLSQETPLSDDSDSKAHLAYVPEVPSADPIASSTAPPAAVAPQLVSTRWKPWMVAAAVASLAVVILTVGPGLSQVRAVLGRSFPNISEHAPSVSRANAEDLYMRGRYYWNKRTPESLTLALDDFTKATQLDPSYALAYAGQADCYNLLREYTSMPPSQAFPLAIAAANKAATLDDRLPEAHRALGFSYFWWNWDIAGGEREFRRAITLNPKDVEAHHWYATALMTVARYPEAVAEIEEARKLDPASSSVAADRATILYAAGREEEAIQLLLELEKSEPTFLSPYVYLRNAYFDRKEYVKSFDQAEVAARLTHDDKALAAIKASRVRLQEGGERAMLLGRLAEQIEQFHQGNGKALDVAETYALLGQNAEAMEYLEKAYQRHEYELITAGYWQGFDGLRSEAGFQDLLKRIGLSSAPRS